MSAYRELARAATRRAGGPTARAAIMKASSSSMHMARQSDVTHPNRSAFPPGMSGPSLRALSVAGVRSMSDVARWTRADLAKLHGMGPKALDVLERALEESGRSFRRP